MEDLVGQRLLSCVAHSHRLCPGGGPSFILANDDSVLLSLGAGAGGASCGSGGDAGFGPDQGVYYAGQDGQTQNAVELNCPGQTYGLGGGTSFGQVGAGGQYDDTLGSTGQTFFGAAGQSDGTGSDGTPVGDFIAAGGGGNKFFPVLFTTNVLTPFARITGAGGGAASGSGVCPSCSRMATGVTTD